MENQEQSQAKGGSSKGLLIVVIVLLLISNGVWGYLFYNKGEEKKVVENQVVTLEDEKDVLVNDLESLRNEFADLEESNSIYEDELRENRLRIDTILTELETLKKSGRASDRAIIAKLRKEAATLRTILKSYVHKVDSLNTLNITLRKEKSVVEKELGEEKGRTAELQNVKEQLEGQVKIGARLEALNMTALAQRVKSNGIHRETTKAAKAQKIKCCMILSANELAKPGKRAVYIRILDPNGKVLTFAEDEEHMFDFKGVRGLYSVKKVIDYQNEEYNLCLYWDVLKELPIGEYIVTAYFDELEIGETKLTLK